MAYKLVETKEIQRFLNTYGFKNCEVVEYNGLSSRFLICTVDNNVKLVHSVNSRGMISFPDIYIYYRSSDVDHFKIVEYDSDSGSLIIPWSDYKTYISKFLGKIIKLSVKLKYIDDDLRHSISMIKLKTEKKLEREKIDNISIKKIEQQLNSHVGGFGYYVFNYIEKKNEKKGGKRYWWSL